MSKFKIGDTVLLSYTGTTWTVIDVELVGGKYYIRAERKGYDNNNQYHEQEVDYLEERFEHLNKKK